MKDYQQKINELRRDIVKDIIDLLKAHNLNKLELPNNLEDLCYVVWFDDDGNAYDSPVRAVSFDKNGICLDVEDEETGYTSFLTSLELGCQNLDWLCKIYENICDTFEHASECPEPIYILPNGKRLELIPEMHVTNYDMNDFDEPIEELLKAYHEAKNETEAKEIKQKIEDQCSAYVEFLATHYEEVQGMVSFDDLSTGIMETLLG